MKSPMLERLKQNLYYCLIAIATFVALTFLPMLGSDVNAGWNFPDNHKGWIVFITLRVIISSLNVFIFSSFIHQGKLNVADNANYQKAVLLISKAKDKEFIPRSPKKFNAHEYGRKGFFVFMATGASLVALTQAILSYDWQALLCYTVTVIGSIIFGIFEMKKVEIYWTIEFLEYAERQYQAQKGEENGRREEDSVS